MMGSKKVVTPSSDATGIPQGIPTGVFVSNKETPAQNTVQQPTATSAPVTAPVAPAAPTEGALDKIFKGLARFIAKVTGQPDPVTGVANTASKVFQQGQNIVGKVRGAANTVVGKATDIAGKAVNTATNVTGKVIDTATNVTNKVVDTTTNVVKAVQQPTPAPTPAAVEPAKAPEAAAPVQATPEQAK